MESTTVLDWQAWLACGLGLLAALHLTRRWWPQRQGRASTASPAAPGAEAGCAVEAPSHCGAGGCGSCGTASAPIRVHRRTSHDTPGATPGP